MVPMVALAAFVAATATSSATASEGDDPRCGSTETYRVIREWRAGEPGSLVAPLRRDSRCEQDRFEMNATLGARQTLVAEDLERRPGPIATVHFRGEPGLQLYVESRRSHYLDIEYDTSFRRRIITRSRVSEYRLLTEHAGTATLAAGSHFFALARADEPLMEVQQPFEVSGPLHVEGHATSYTDARLWAAVSTAAGILGVLVGSVWVVAESTREPADHDFTVPGALVGGGLAASVIGVVLLGLVLDDETSLEVQPSLGAR